MTNHVLKHEGRQLRTLLSKVDELKQLNDQFSRHLDPELAKHCQAIKVDRDCLIVLVDNSNWATRLRFYIPDLLPKLKTYLPLQNLKAICSKVRPDYKSVKSQRRIRRPIPLSKQAAEMMLETAKNIKDKELSKVLERIARRFVEEE